MSFLTFTEHKAVTKRDFTEVKNLLSNAGLTLDDDVTWTILLRHEKTTIATASLAGNIIKCIAIQQEYRGHDITGQLITSLLGQLHSQQIFHSFIYTRPNNEDFFHPLGFSTVSKVIEGEGVILLENGDSISAFLEKNSSASATSSGAIVMNCNPLTLGHLYLIEKAAAACDHLYLFLVSADRSLFTWEIRQSIVKRAITRFKNVTLLPTGPYQVSSVTFPTYFTRTKQEATRLQTLLDVTIFTEHFAPHFNITKRFVGTEPYCPVTAAYNLAMQELLPPRGVEVVEIERKTHGNSVISASIVRQLLRRENPEEAHPFLPPETIDFLTSEAGVQLIQKIKQSDSPH